VNQNAPLALSSGSFGGKCHDLATTQAGKWPSIIASPNRSCARSGRLHSGGRRLHGMPINCPTATIPHHPSAANGCPLSPRPIALSPVATRPCRRFSFSFPRAANQYWGRLSKSGNLAILAGMRRDSSRVRRFAAPSARTVATAINIVFRRMQDAPSASYIVSRQSRLRCQLEFFIARCEEDHERDIDNGAVMLKLRTSQFLTHMSVFKLAGCANTFAEGIGEVNYD
jgi:hypothetical protein